MKNTSRTLPEPMAKTAAHSPFFAPVGKESPAAKSFFAPVVQPKLQVGAVDSPAEREAEAMANHVVQQPSPLVQRKCDSCEQEEKLHRQTTSPASSESGQPVSPEVGQQIEASRGSGPRLEAHTRQWMEGQFAADFSQVNIHTGSSAQQISKQLQAKAFTVGQDIYFDQNQYQPETREGKHLLAHELAHTLQQGPTVRRQSMPKGPNGRPLGFFPTAEQEAYDQLSYEIREWDKVVERLAKGELDDRDMANARLMDRITGLTTAEVNTLITNVQAHQTKDPTLVVTKLVEYLEVRKVISTPMPPGASISRDPITNAVESYSMTINGVVVKVVKDTFGNTRNNTGPVTNFGFSYSWATNGKDLVTTLKDNTSGAPVNINPTALEITIRTRYQESPDAPSGYGKGTTADDKRNKTTSLRVHEGQHGTDYLAYIKSRRFPVNLSAGVVGVLHAADMQSIDAYISGITKASCELTDQSGFSQDEFIETTAGIASGITSCRRP